MKRFFIFLSIFTLVISMTFGVIAANERSELAHMRNEYVKVFKNDDGTVTRQYWINPIHYRDENNQWQEIDRTIFDTEKNGKIKSKVAENLSKIQKDNLNQSLQVENYNKAVVKHLFNMYFPKKLNQPIQFKYNDTLLSMEPLNVSHLNKQKEKIKALVPNNNEITYNEAWYHTDLKYEIGYNNIREYIILNDIDAERSFSFFLKAKGVELQKMPNGDIGAYAKKNGELLYRLPKPIMWDADMVYCKDIYFELTREKNGYILSFKINEDYINAPERAFPVTIDPDIVLARNYVDEMTFMDTDEPNTNFFSSSRMEVGNYKIWNFWFWNHWEKKRALFRFNRLTADLGPVSDQVEVRQAKLYLYCSDNDTESTFTDVYHVNYDATDWEVTQVTWNSPWGSGGDSVLPANEDTWVYVAENESTPRTYVCYLNNDTVETWIHSNEVLNKGLMLVDYYEGDETKTLKVFNNAALELTLNERIFMDVSATTYANTPQSIQFNCSAYSTDTGSNMTYQWDFDINDGYNDQDTRQNPIYCYQTPGEHAYSVKAIDANGNSRIYYGTVYVNPVEMNFYYGSTTPSNLRLTTDTYYNCTYSWNFGDGSPNYYGRDAYHQYSTEGTYPVQLTISNSYGVNPLVLTKNLYYYHPIVFVHGYTGGFTSFEPAYNYFNQVLYEGDLTLKNFSRYDNLSGLPVHTVFNFDYYRDYAADAKYLFMGCLGTDNQTVFSTDSGNGSYGDQYNSLDHRYSQMLGQGVDQVLLSTGFDKVDLIGHSMGGLVSRSYIKYWGGNAKVDKLMTIGTPNHGIPDLEAFVAKYVVADEPWMRELEVREMAHNNDSFYQQTSIIAEPIEPMPIQTLSTSKNTTTIIADDGIVAPAPITEPTPIDSTIDLAVDYKGWVEILNNDGDISVNGENISGCNGNDTVGPTQYVTIAGRDNGNVNVPLVDLIWEAIAPDDGVVESGSVRLNGTNVVANLDYPGIHNSDVPGERCELQVIHQTPFIASYANAWMRQDRTLNAVASKPAAWVEVEQYSDGTVKKFIVHTGATKNNALWTWAMLQHQDEVQTENGVDYYFTFKEYNSFWKDLTNATTSDEVLIDLSPAHYLPGDILRVTVVTYDSFGQRIEYIPVQL